MNGNNRNFPPGGWGKGPRRRRVPGTPPRGSEKRPIRRRPTPKSFSPLTAIREASVRKKLDDYNEIRTRLFTSEDEGDYLQAIKEARTIIIQEQNYYNGWGKVHRENVRRAVQNLEQRCELLRRKSRLTEKEADIRKMYQYEIRRGNALLENYINITQWAERWNKILSRVIDSCGEKISAYEQKILGETMNKLNREGYFHSLMGYD